jgi:CS domain
MPDSPPPEERERLDAEARAKEAEEQAKLPYKWTQSIGDVDITVPVPGNIKGRDLDVVMTKTKLKAGLKGQTPIIDVSIPFSIVHSY